MRGLCVVGYAIGRSLQKREVEADQKVEGDQTYTWQCQNKDQDSIPGSETVDGIKKSTKTLDPLPGRMHIGTR
jgi:hypothetical protein